MTARLVFAVDLTVRSPFLFRDLAAGAYGVDATQMRHANGDLILPADQFRGVMREALEDLADATDGAVIDHAEVVALFGEPSDTDGAQQDQPRRGTALFGDLVASTWREAAGTPERNLAGAAGLTTRIEIEDATGAVKRGHLFTIDLPIPFAAEATFGGEFVVFAEADKAERLTEAFGKALNVVLAIGAFKSPGFGEIVGSSVTCLRREPLIAKTIDAGKTRIEFRLTFDRPFLVDARRDAFNCFVGSVVVPGTAIKGALARRLELAGRLADQALSDALAAMSISHAYPESSDGRRLGTPLPLSIVAREDDSKTIHFADALTIEAGRGGWLAGGPAIFQGDWKGKIWREMAMRFALPQGDEPARIPRTHTAIAIGDVAEDEQLFTIVARSNLSRAGQPLAWRFFVDTSAIADRRLAAELLGHLECGLDGIGRTDARVDLNRIQTDVPSGVVRPVHGTTKRYAIMLETPALLFDPRGAQRSDGGFDKWQSARKAYTAYWSAACPGAALLDFVAEQEFAGGYLGIRRRLYGKDVYYPFILTKAGSVFLLEGDIGDQLTSLALGGLPLPKFNGRTPEWRDCPYVPENGYGCIADHLADQALIGALDELEHV